MCFSLHFLFFSPLSLLFEELEGVKWRSFLEQSKKWLVPRSELKPNALGLWCRGSINRAPTLRPQAFNPNRSLDLSDQSDLSDTSDWSDRANDRFGFDHNSL
ncbi:hypothetical protein [Prevotella ihumii]|uniref:hypothetical protein n=1 Tax=Prevotella ihumii TaxID=1917878 RepID=UPI00117EF80F|nr:hypothetical protein [Prevotella ihumii]